MLTHFNNSLFQNSKGNLNYLLDYKNTLTCVTWSRLYHNCTPMAFLEQYLYTKRSQIRDAGLGLFTRIKIPKGVCIVEYKGRLVKWVDIKHEDGYNGYILRVNRSWAINAKPYKKALGRFANDARGIHRKENLKNNAEYLLEGDRCFIYSTREILPNAEILVSYGSAYWNLAKRIAKSSLK